MNEKVHDQREELYAAQQAGIRIVKLGSRPEDKVYRAGCQYCRTEIEFKRSSARFQEDQRDGDYLAVNCPVCRHIITVGV